VSTLEGLAYSRGPCAKVLSVAGFFDALGLLPGREEVYSQGERASFLTREASPLQHARQHCRTHWSHACCTGQYGEYWVYMGGYVQGGTPTNRVPGRHIGRYTYQQGAWEAYGGSTHLPTGCLGGI